MAGYLFSNIRCSNLTFQKTSPSSTVRMERFVLTVTLVLGIASCRCESPVASPTTANPEHYYVRGSWVAASYGSYFNVSEAVTILYSENRQHVSVCRVRVNDRVTVPGKYMPKEKHCGVALDNEQAFDSYEILLKTPDMRWERVRRGETPHNAILAGYEYGNPVLICRSSFYFDNRRVTLPGKVVTSRDYGSSCYYVFDGTRDAGNNYEILVSDRF